MLPKRIFWLTCAAFAGWLIWTRLRQRNNEFATTIPQFAPPRTFTPAIPAEPTAPATPVEPAAHPPAPEQAPAATPAPAPPAEDASPAGTENDALAADVPEAHDDAEVEISGYCMRCKTKRQIQNAQRETTESGRPAARGTCPVCGANMFTFLSTNDVP